MHCYIFFGLNIGGSNNSYYTAKNDNDVAVLVNSEVIENKDIYRADNASTIAGSGFEQGEIIKSLIETKLIINEAERLGLEVNSDAIKNNIDAVKAGYKNRASGTEVIRNIMQQLDMSEEEYWVYQEEAMYAVYIKSELQIYLESKNKDFDGYVKYLTENADIKFIDAQLERVYYNHN